MDFDCPFLSYCAHEKSLDLLTVEKEWEGVEKFSFGLPLKFKICQ